MIEYKATSITGIGTTTEQLIQQLLEDSSLNTYHIGYIRNKSGTFLRKESSDGTNQWTLYNEDYKTSPNNGMLINSDAQIAICAFDGSNGFTYLEINTSNGAFNKVYTASTLVVFPGAFNPSFLCGATPSKNAFYFLAKLSSDSNNVYLSKFDITNPSANIQISKIADAGNINPKGILALSDTKIIFQGEVKSASTFDSVSLASANFAATPTMDWNVRFSSGTSANNQYSAVVATADMTQVISAAVANNSNMVVHVFNVADGSIAKKILVSGGFTFNPNVLDIKIQGTTVYIAIRQGLFGTGAFAIINTADSTGSVYQGASNNIFGGVSQVLNGNVMWLLGSINQSPAVYTLNKFNINHSEFLEDLLTKSTTTTVSAITNTDFDTVTHAFSPAASTTASVASATPSLTSDTPSVLDGKKLVLNVWNTATTQTSLINSGQTTFTPTYTCFVATSMTSPTQTYTLVDGTTSVPSWASVNDTTAEIKYTPPSTTSSENFILRSTVTGKTGNYDTTINLVISDGSTPSSSSQNSGSTQTASPTQTTSAVSTEDEDDYCFNLDTRVECAVVLTVIIICAIVLTGVLIAS